MSQTIRVVALQPALRWQPPAGGMPNLHLVRQMIEKHVAAEPADLLVLPEVFNGITCDDDPDAGPVARRFLATLAKACHVAIVSSLDFAHADARRNTCFAVDGDGTEAGLYHKRVMFGREVGVREPGDGPGIFTLAGVRVGVLICGDLWRPDLVMELRGAVDLLCVATKTTVPDATHTDYARRLWHHLALIRAMESGLPIVVADWAEGRNESIGCVDGQRVKSVHYTSGGSSITDPSRRPQFDRLQQKLPAGEPGLLSATIDLDAMAAFRDYRRSIGLLPG